LAAVVGCSRWVVSVAEGAVFMGVSMVWTDIDMISYQYLINHFFTPIHNVFPQNTLTL